MSHKDIFATATDDIIDNIGVSATYSPVGGGDDITLNVVFGHSVVWRPDGSQTWDKDIVLSINLADLTTAPAKGDMVTIDSTVYAVHAIQNSDELSADLVVIRR